MDFNLDETQQELRKLAAEVLAKEEDERLWPALQQAGLVDLCQPGESGAVEMAVVLREVGAVAADVPLLAHLAGTLALAEHGRVVEGRVGVALRGKVLSDKGLTGRMRTVTPAETYVVAADDGLYLVTEPVTEIAEFTSTGEPAATLVFDATPAERVAESADGLRNIHAAAVAAQASGVLAGALKLTTEYIRTRRQFGRALAEFQAVTMQIADVYIAGRALDVAMWSGAWSLDPRDLALAGFHVSEAFRALYTCQHLHGGLGLDVTYPLHRYFAQAKHLAQVTGGADAQLDLIGATC